MSNITGEGPVLFDTYLQMHTCRGNSSITQESFDNCGRYPTLLFVCTCIVGCFAYRLDPMRAFAFSTANSSTSNRHFLLNALVTLASFPIAFYGYAFVGSKITLLYLGRGMRSIAPPPYKSPQWTAYIVVWLVTCLVLKAETIKKVRRSIGLFGFVLFIAQVDIAITTYNLVVEARLDGAHVVQSVFAGCLINSSGYFVREILLNLSGDFNIARHWANILNVLSFDMLYCLVCYYAPLRNSFWFLGLTIANATLSSFVDGRKQILLKRVQTQMTSVIFGRT